MDAAGVRFYRYPELLKTRMDEAEAAFLATRSLPEDDEHVAAASIARCGRATCAA